MSHALLIYSIAAAGLIIAPVSITGISTLTFAQQQQQQKFTAKLMGSEEVPPKSNTKATGNAEFLPSANGTMIDYSVNITNIDNVTIAHIHAGKTGENGPILVRLFKSATPYVFRVIGGSYLLAQGNLTSSDLQGLLDSKKISDLVNIMKNGQLYVNVHTDQNTNGEIRGQILRLVTRTG